PGDGLRGALEADIRAGAGYAGARRHLCIFGTFRKNPSEPAFAVASRLAWRRGYRLATAAKLRDVRRGRIRISLERCYVLIDSFERGPRYPAKHCRYNEILVWVHFNVVNLRVAGHRSAGREHTGLPLRSNAGRMNVGEVNAPLLPTRGDEVPTDKAQHAFAMPYGCAAEQDVGLIDAVNRSVRWNLATGDMGEV